MSFKAFKYKLYRSKKNRRLIHRIEVASQIWNQALEFRRLYYQVYKKHLSSNFLQKLIKHLTKRPAYKHWKKVGSQAIQDVIQRMDKGYARFFQEIRIAKATGRRCLFRPPQFRSYQKYKSLTLKQAGYQYTTGTNQIEIGGFKYRFHLSRPLEGEIKTLTIKRNKLGELFLFFTCFLPEETTSTSDVVMTGQRAGFDFGLKTFLTASDEKEYQGLQVFKRSFQKIQEAHRKYSSKKKGSHQQQKARLHLARTYRDVTYQREDFQWKLAHQLIATYDTFYFETLNFEEMKARWGRKISDLAPASFLIILKYLSGKVGKTFFQIDKWFPSSKRCSHCLEINHQLTLWERVWTCPFCQTTHQRDVNAAKNIEMEGVGASTPSRDVVRLGLKDPAFIDDARIPRL